MPEYVSIGGNLIPKAKYDLMEEEKAKEAENKKKQVKKEELAKVVKEKIKKK